MKNLLNESMKQRELLELQRLFLQGKIKESDMTEEQILALGNFFQSQIDIVQRKNYQKRQKLLKALLRDENTIYLLQKFQIGEIQEYYLTKDEVNQLNFMYDMEIQKVKKDIQNLQLQYN